MGRKTPARSSACDGKLRFLNWSQAHDGLRALTRKTGENYAIYRCRYCQRFHVGHYNRNLK